MLYTVAPAHRRTAPRAGHSCRAELVIDSAGYPLRWGRDRFGKPRPVWARVRCSGEHARFTDGRTMHHSVAGSVWAEGTTRLSSGFASVAAADWAAAKRRRGVKSVPKRRGNAGRLKR